MPLAAFTRSFASALSTSWLETPRFSVGCRKFCSLVGIPARFKMNSEVVGILWGRKGLSALKVLWQSAQQSGESCLSGNILIVVCHRTVDFHQICITSIQTA